ncbi:MAG: hypothetical protein WBZ36_30665 [Candidatus Nitrosopolaris sp.]
MRDTGLVPAAAVTVEPPCIGFPKYLIMDNDEILIMDNSTPILTNGSIESKQPLIRFFALERNRSMVLIIFSTPFNTTVLSEGEKVI